jgi:hypothetical protein
MKTKRIIAAAIMIAATLSCQKEEALPVQETTAGSHTVSIHASVGGTKTVISQDLEGHFKGEWEAGDVLYVKEFVTGVSSDPGLDEIDSASDFVATEPLAAGGPIATFRATFDPYYWESTLTTEELATYTFTYKYLACSYNPYYMNGDSIPLLIDPDQDIYAGGYSTADDMLVSRFSEYSSRPSDISFNFARLGTVVKITLKGLQEGDEVKSGTWFTGDNLKAACRLEDIISYYPETGQYVYEVPQYMEDMLGDCYHISFSNPDSTRPIVADSNGEAVLYLRTLPGVLDDWFGIICTVDRGGSDLKFSKLVDLSSLGRSLTFKDGGLTMFSVDVKPAVVGLPEPIMYISPKPRTGFTAAWPADNHATGYECYYQRYGDYWDDVKEEYVYYDKVSLTPVAGTGEMADMYYVEVPSGLEADKYTLYVKAIPDSDSGLSDFGYAQKEMYIGITKSIDWPDVDSYGSQTHLDKSMDPIWKVTEDGEEYFPWYFNVSNLKTNWGYLYSADGSSAWTLSSCTTPSMQHQGEIDHLTLKMSNTKENTSTVYGIAPDGTATVITQPEAGYWSSSEKYYDYDFTVGSYNGFRIESGGPLYVTMLRIYFYAPEE